MDSDHILQLFFHRMTKKIIPTFFIAIIAIALLNPISAAQAQQDGNVRAFILLTDDSDNSEKLVQIRAFIKADGGQVTHTFPNQAIIAQIPTNTIQQLTTLPGVVGVFTQPVELSIMDIYGPEARRLVGVWNSLIADQDAAASDMNFLAAESPDEHDDAFLAPDMSSLNGAGIAANTSVTPGYYQTSEYMAGSVAVGIVLVESNGGLDPSTEDWTADERQLVFNEIVAALNWWAELEPRANLSFVYDDHFSYPLPTGVEPITRPYFDQQYWIADAMGALGYNASSYFTRVRDYNNDLRDIYQTDWAFTIFVVDSSNDADNYFSNGYFAYAYLGGPFMVMTYGNNGYGPYNMDAVAAHEVGHIFRALDQYYNAYQPCTRRSGYLDIENMNSQYGGCASNVPSIMRGQVFPYTSNAIDSYAAGQVGWRDSDGDDILDPLDVELPVNINTLVQDGNNVTINGSANIIPYPSPRHTSVTINTLTNTWYRFDGGGWQEAMASDGAFDTVAENFHFTATSLPPGLHTLEVAAVDSAGNISDVYATESIMVLDDIDGGLNTELYAPAGTISISEVSEINGVAYQLPDGGISQVEYRVDGGPWQSAGAKDGVFDSSYETFTLTTDMSNPGIYLVEARAIDAAGNVEVNYASQQIEVAEKPQHSIFLPIVVNGASR